MTSADLKIIALRCANSNPTRFWMHLNYPNQDPWLMGIKIWDVRAMVPGVPVTHPELHRQIAEAGGWFDHANGMWLFERTDCYGKPFTSKL